MDVEKILRKMIRAAWCCLPKGKRVPLIRAVIHQAGADEQRSIGVTSLGAGLSQLRGNGFLPNSVIDVGANRGNWTLETQSVFPSASFVLVDADPANDAFLAQVCSSRPHCKYFITLLGAESRDGIRFYQMGTGSSVLSERSLADRNELSLRMNTLDDLVAAEVKSPILLKLDVQGYELEVLRGAVKTLSEAEVVIIECSLIQYNEGAPLFAEVVSFMGERGFVVYDFCGQMRRANDGALFQMDVIFVRENSRLRKEFDRWIAKG
jgi:FkbM family methyltransferase